MDFTVNSKIIAAVNALPPYLAPILGASELVFPFDAIIHDKSDGYYRWLAIESARVCLRTKDGRTINIGTARSDEAVELRQVDGTGRKSFTLKIALSPHQMELLEVERDGGDLDFNLAIALQGSDSTRHPYHWPEHAEFRIPVPQSAWIAQLNAAKADQILLFELRLPRADDALATPPAAKHLLQAVQLMRAGNWRQCVAECRQFAEALGGPGLTEAFNRLSNDRKTMTKAEREAALLAALQHYGHLAAHSESKFGTIDFTRTDAKLALSVAAALAAHHMPGTGGATL